MQKEQQEEKKNMLSDENGIGKVEAYPTEEGFEEIFTEPTNPYDDGEEPLNMFLS